MMLPFAVAERRKIAVGLLMVMALAAGEGLGLRAQSHFIQASAPGLIETGAPMFEVRTYQTLGLDAPPTDLHVLPDGRLVLIAGEQIAIGDGVRWERFQQAANDALAPAETVAVDGNGDIYMGVAGGFARVEFGGDARWRLRVIASWKSDDPSRLPILRFAVQNGDDWFWHGDSGPLAARRDGAGGGARRHDRAGDSIAR